jgi:3D-(3,5/4)-trihydroxycyclohexane-1,2-dione acylhydrolase (decyclizing)
VPEVSTRAAVLDARRDYESAKQRQRSTTAPQHSTQVISDV